MGGHSGYERLGDRGKVYAVGCGEVGGGRFMRRADGAAGGHGGRKREVEADVREGVEP